MTTKIAVTGSVAPADTITPMLILGYEMGRAGTSSVVDIPGRGGPTVGLHTVQKRRGTYSFLLADEPAAVAFDALLSRKETYTLTDTTRPIFNMTFALDKGGFTIKLDPDTRTRFVASVEVVEL